MSETRLTTNGPPVHTTTTTAVTAETPTECPALNAPTTNTALLLEVDGHDLERRGQSISALLEFRAAAELREKDARIRGLEAVLIGIKDTLRALARSEGGGA